MSPTLSAKDAGQLKQKYDEIEDKLFNNVYGLPFYLESSNVNRVMHGEVYGVLYYPFKEVTHALSSMHSWCEIMPQHLNIKACTYEIVDSQCRLTFYSDRKEYVKADNAYKLNYNFTITALNENYFHAILDAKKGPFGTKDYNIIVNAIPLSDNSTFFYLSYEYSYGIMTSIATSTYLATIGHDKVGFSYKGVDKNNTPVYVDGVRGVIERNAIRYYFAILSYLNTVSVVSHQRFEKRISNWFNLTESYAKQLHELDKNDYITFKRRERLDQTRLQKDINEKMLTEKVPATVLSTDHTCHTNNG